MSRLSTSPRTFGGSRGSGTNGRSSLSVATDPSSPSAAGSSGVSLGHGAPPSGGPSTGHRYTSLSSLMKSPDRERAEWNGSSSSYGTNGGTPRRAHFSNKLTLGSGSTPHKDGPSWTIPGTEGAARNAAPLPSKKKERPHMSLWNLISLTIAMGGSQIVWTVELGYGTPYLLELGLSEQHTSLVWLAGPISGLVVQPLIGAISDSSTSKYRRRFWVVASTALLVLSLLGLAYSSPVAKALVDLFGGGQGDWDPKGKAMVRYTAILIAVFCFYTLDFALNGLQASLRNLVFDVTPTDQLNTANAWNGRFLHIGNVVGFFLGFMNLNGIPVIRWIGGDQFRKLCILSMLILVLTCWITCFTVEEDERPTLFGERRSKLRHMVNTIHEAILNLPKAVRRICFVQILAFMGWFPFLFYATTYVENVMSYQLGHEADRNEATRAGSLALLIYSFVATAAGTVLPYFSERDKALLPSEDEDEVEDEQIQVHTLVQKWKADRERTGKKIRLPKLPHTLRNIWTAALVFFFFLMMSTFFIVNVVQASIMISLVGICWAVACWVPFAMIMEFLKELEESQNQQQLLYPESAPRSHTRSASLGNPGQFDIDSETSTLRSGERRPLLGRSYSAADLEDATQEYAHQGPVAGGTIMGIHNLAIVLPQFIIAIVASIIFRLADGPGNAKSLEPPQTSPPDHGGGGTTDPIWHPKTGVAWVLRFGGLMALIGALICRRVPPTKQEKTMRRRLAEIKEALDE